MYSISEQPSPRPHAHTYTQNHVLNEFDVRRVDKGHIIHQGFLGVFCAERTELVIQLFMQISSYPASLEEKLRIYSIQKTLSLSLSSPDAIKTFYDSML